MKIAFGNRIFACKPMFSCGQRSECADLLNSYKYIIYASFYVIVIKTGMDFYEYKRFPKLYEPNSAPWYTEALLYCVASFAVIIVCFALRVIIKRKMKKG